MSLKPLFTTGDIYSSPIRKNDEDVKYEAIFVKKNNESRPIATVLTDTGQGMANLNLYKLAPELFNLATTVAERIDNILSSEEFNVSDDLATELNDIQSVIWELLNKDGNLNGMASYF